MNKYSLIISDDVYEMTTDYVRFISNVSIRTAKAFRKELADVFKEIRNNPYQFPIDEDPYLAGQYRKAVFATWFKALFMVDDTNIYLDAIVDCRMNYSDYIP